jgi:hypothetical protein
MSRTHDPASVLLPSDEQARAFAASLMFSRSTIGIVYWGATAIGVGLLIWSMLGRTALLTPVDPNLRAAMIGSGVFLGVLVAFIEREAWLLGFGGRRAPKGVFVAVGMSALIIASGFGGDFLARKAWEWRAFHGLHPRAADHVFTAVSHSIGRSGSSLELRDAATNQTVRIACSDATAEATHDGEQLILPFETGRGGVQRVTLPALKALRHI